VQRDVAERQSLARFLLAGPRMSADLGILRDLHVATHGLQTNSVPVLTGVTLLLIAIAQVACYVPARYAS
jgi:hypothetical protein